MLSRFSVAAGALLVVGLHARAASAGCTAAEGYAVHAAAGTVVICPSNPDGDGGAECRGGAALLRQEIDGGVVTVPNLCDDAGCYVDPCVTPGTYRYGYANPYACCGSCCGTSFFESVTVKPYGDACAPPADAGPADAGGAPWGDDASICGYAGADGGADGGADAGDAGGPVTVPADARTMLPDTGAADAGVAPPPSAPPGGCGCSEVGAQGGVLLADLGALVLGAGFVLRRRRRARAAEGQRPAASV